jgi:hypothetical protein
MGFIITNVKKSKNFLMTNRATDSLISLLFLPFEDKPA